MGLRGKTRLGPRDSSGREPGLSALHVALGFQKETPEPEAYPGCANHSFGRTRREEQALRAPSRADVPRHYGGAVCLPAERVPAACNATTAVPSWPLPCAGCMLSTSAPGPRATLGAGGAQHCPREAGTCPSTRWWAAEGVPSLVRPRDPSHGSVHTRVRQNPAPRPPPQSSLCL